MPLHDWTDDRGWDSVHQRWINSLLFWLQDRLPTGYRAYLGSVPGLAIEAESGRPDPGVRAWQSPGREMREPPSGALVEEPQPDFQAVALLNPEPPSAIHVFHQGRLVAAIELVSPRNKDRPSAREFYRNRSLGYLWTGVNLLLADVHRRPSGYSFVEAMAAELQCQFPVGLPPHWDIEFDDDSRWRSWRAGCRSLPWRVLSKTPRRRPQLLRHGGDLPVPRSCSWGR